MDNESLNEDVWPVLDEYISTLIAREKEVHDPTVTSFQAKENEIRTKIEKSFRYFQKTFSHRYTVLLKELQREMEMSRSKENLLALASVDQEKLQIFKDTEKLLEAFEKGSSIYELLGFSEQSLKTFYQVMHRLVESKEFKKAYDISYFLVTIAPGVYQFWVYFGRCAANLQEHETALHVLAKAIEIDPREAAAYMEMIDLLIEAHEFKKATNLCNAGLEVAAAHPQEPWAETLRLELEEKRHIIPLKRKSYS